ncbi:MAG: Mut7-C RNAse domain-containing protein, partial [Bacteroidales bacterium]
KGHIKPFTRCMVCNGMIEAVGKSEIESKLQANTRKAFDEFFRCSTCGKIYWKGSHYEKMYEMIRDL